MTPEKVTANDVRDELSALLDAAEQADGARALNDDTLLSLDDREILAVRKGRELVAISTREGSEAELVVRPDVRRQGVGTALLAKTASAAPEALTVWAHGNVPGARKLAQKASAVISRELFRMSAEVPSDVPQGESFDTFIVGADEGAWLRVNRAAFATHPEQGTMTLKDLRAREAEDWFDASAFLVARDGDVIEGFSWLKITPEDAEVYVLGVSPDRAGRGLGKRLLDASLALFRDRGFERASLYVDGDNAAALALYRSRGFDIAATDVQYTLPPTLPEPLASALDS